MRTIVNRTGVTIRALPTTANLGVNLAWLNKHDATQSQTFFGATWDVTKITADLDLVQGWGLTKLRVWAPLEGIMEWTGSAFAFHATYPDNVDTFLTLCAARGISVILVMGDGGNSAEPTNLNGKFHWDLVQSAEGITTQVAAQVAYVNRFKHHSNILMWEIMNEPYYNYEFDGGYAQGLGVTKDQAHTYVKAAYDAIKPLVGSTYVGFSDLEEENQAKYRVFSDATNRANYVDDCTDVYSMHIYRPDYTWLYSSWQTVTGKPKWITELGALNYIDPSASSHPIPGNGELRIAAPNLLAVKSIASYTLNQGFQLVMPWSVADNNTVVVHNANGTHTNGVVADWLVSALAPRAMASRASV